MLTYRQVKIISILLGTVGKVTTEYLSNTLNVSTKTIQKEIKSINNFFEEIKISYHSETGYNSHLTTEEQHKLAGILELLENERYEFSRGNHITLSLAFEKKYISMEKLAQKLFISKTSINQEMNSYWRLRRIIDVSHTQGLKINLKESKIRLTLAKTAILGPKIIEILKLKEVFTTYLPKLNQIVAQIFCQEKLMISGKQTHEFIQYLFFTIIRNERGFKIEKQKSVNEVTRVVMKICLSLEKELSVSFSPDDLTAINNKYFQMSNYNEKIIPINSEKKMARFYAEKFIKNIQLKINQKLEPNTELFERFVIHLEKMLWRINQNEHYTNFSKRSLNQAYPLGAHLVRDCFEPVLDGLVKDSELAYLVPYTDALLDNNEQEISVLFITNLNPGMAYPILLNLKKHLKNLPIKAIELVPDYIYETKKEIYNDRYQLFLTTKSSLTFIESEMILIKEIIQPDDYEQIKKQVHLFLQKKKQYDLENIRQKLNIPNSFIFEEVHYNDLSDFLKTHAIEIRKDSYKILLEDHIAFFPSFLKKKKSFVSIYVLKNPIGIKQQQIDYIVVSGCNPFQNNVQLFYQVLKSILKEDNLKYYL